MLFQYSIKRQRKNDIIINRTFWLLMILLALASLAGCSNDVYSVNKRINSYSYVRNHGIMKTPEQFYKDGGGDCKDFANAKKAILGGEIVMLPELFTQDGEHVTHVVLKVDGFLLDSRFNDLRLASSINTIPYGVN